MAAAQELADAGLDVHVDVMAVSEGLPAGVSLAELQMISAAVDRRRIGVHLIGSADFVDAVLPKILALRPGVVFLPWHAFTDERADAIRAAGGSAWIAVWREWDGLGDPQWPAEPDGVLVMLIEPGTRDSCRLDRLRPRHRLHDEVLRTARSRRRRGHRGVAPLCAAAGVQQMVVGRALLTSTERKEAI